MTFSMRMELKETATQILRIGNIIQCVQVLHGIAIILSSIQMIQLAVVMISYVAIATKLSSVQLRGIASNLYTI